MLQSTLPILIRRSQRQLSWNTCQIRSKTSWRGTHKSTSKLPEWRKSNSENGIKTNTRSDVRKTSGKISDLEKGANFDGDIDDLKRAFFQNVGNYRKANNHNKKTSNYNQSNKPRYNTKKSEWRTGGNNSSLIGSKYLNDLDLTEVSRKPNSSKKDKATKQKRSQTNQAVIKEQSKIVRLPTHLPSISSIKLASILRVKRERINNLCSDLDIPLGEQIEMEMATLVCEELGYEVEPAETEEEEKEFLEDLNRPLVVSIMGHVDHGKTTLLDALRKRSNHPERPVAGSEAGGITQKITAFQIPASILENSKNDKMELLTILDTPGHAAFSEMRRICQSASDLVILCIDIRQGVADQTKEIISYLKKSKCQFMIALTKCDLIETSAERDKLQMKVESQLAEFDIMTESFGGDIQVVPVSSVTGQGLDTLVSSTNYFYEPQPKAISATVLNSESGAGGKLLSVVLHQPISSGSIFVLESSQTNAKKYGKIRSIMPISSDSSSAKALDFVGSSTPVMLLTEVEGAVAGDTICIVDDEETARNIVEKAEEISIFENYTTSSDEATDNTITDNVAVIPLLLKSPTSASLAALQTSLESLQASNPGKFQFNIINSEVGSSMTQKEQIMLKESNGVFLGFDIPSVPKKITKNFAKNQIMSNDIIYRLLDDTKTYVAEKFLPQIETHSIHGTGKILQVFSITSENKKTKVNIAGLEVTSGVLSKQHSFKLKKGNSDEVFEQLKCESLRRFKDEVNEVKGGDECGLQLGEFSNFAEGDIVECYSIIKETQKLI